MNRPLLLAYAGLGTAIPGIMELIRVWIVAEQGSIEAGRGENPTHRRRGWDQERGTGPEGGTAGHTASVRVVEKMAKTIYVGNLPFSASEEDVRDLFQVHGEVLSVKLITDRETGRPRGFGFVDMDDSSAATAIRELDGKDFGGRPLRINEAKERPRSGGGGRPAARR